MTKVFVDHHPFAPRQACHTIEELVAQIRTSMASGQRMIVSIRCDDRSVPDAEIEATLQRRVDDYQRLDFGTALIHTLAGDAVEAAQELLRSARPMQARAAELLADDRNDEALALLGGCIGQWTQAHDAVANSVRLLNLDIEMITHDDRTLLDVLRSVADELLRLKSCLQARDFVLLDDLLRYEIQPTFKRWEETTGALLEEIARQTPQPISGTHT